MSVDVKIIDKETYIEKMDNLALAILGLTANQGGEVAIKSWSQVQQIVRMGLAQKFFSIGDILYAEKESAITIACSNSSVNVSISAETFVEAMGTSGNIDYEFTYDGVEWHLNDTPVNLTTLGITATGTAVADDKIVVHETADDIAFLVVGFDQETLVDTTREHSMTLLMLYTFTSVQYSQSQAGFYFADGLSAGSYSITIGNYDTTYGGNATYYFTLAQAIPSGGQLRLDWAYNTNVVDRKISTYASNSATTTLETNVSVSTTAISGAVNLGTLANSTISTATITDYAGQTKSVQINNVTRMRYGSNNWEESAIRQWCNSNKTKNNVWTPKSPFDRPPSWYSTLDGFMHGLDPHLVNAIAKVKKTTVLNNITDGGGSKTTEETCWLMSMGEMGVNGYSVEGSQYEWYKQLLNGTIADGSTHTELIKTNKAGTAQYWWLRSPDTGYANIFHAVLASGIVSGSNAYNGYQAVVGFAIA